MEERETSTKVGEEKFNLHPDLMEVIVVRLHQR